VVAELLVVLRPKTVVLAVVVGILLLSPEQEQPTKVMLALLATAVLHRVVAAVVLVKQVRQETQRVLVGMA
jgi:threonine/homoserine/homoserine lactone efflux protein